MHFVWYNLPGKVKKQFIINLLLLLWRGFKGLANRYTATWNGFKIHSLLEKVWKHSVNIKQTEIQKIRYEILNCILSGTIYWIIKKQFIINLLLLLWRGFKGLANRFTATWNGFKIHSLLDKVWKHSVNIKQTEIQKVRFQVLNCILSGTIY